ncbi:hypothetical protein ACMFMF_011758 [Clarireedia jacksonii]
MGIHEADITTTRLRDSMAEKRPEQAKWALEGVEEQTISEVDSRDDMSHDTLHDMPFSQKESMTSKFQIALKDFAITLLPSPISRLWGYKVDVSNRQGPTAYLDGMRGVASFCVFLEHVAMRFHPLMFGEYGNHPSFWQLPIIRLVFSGSVMVAIFFVISGFSLALRPIEMIYERDWERLHHTLSSATFRRAFRILLPPAAATFMMMLGVRMHLFDSKYSGTVDMDLDGPIYRENFLLQFVDWLEYVFSKLIYPYEWATPLHNVTDSEYAAPLYTIPKELWSSYLLFITITGLGRLRPAVRIVFTAILIYFAFWCERYDISCFLCGMLIAEHHVRRARSTCISSSLCGRIGATFGWSAVLFIGFWLASIPHTHGSYGSHTFGYQLIATVIPWEPNVFVPGAILIRIFITAIPRYLGQISFGLYLVHWPILAAWGWSLQPAIWKLTGNDTDFNHALGFGISIICITPVVVCVADVFWRTIDLKCIKLAKRFETELVVQTHI